MSKEKAKKAIEKIKNIRDEIKRTHGTYKYNSCYNDCIEVIKNIYNLKDEKERTN